MSQEEITRESFELKGKEIRSKWKAKASTIDKNDPKAALKFYRANKFELWEDIEELYDMSVILSIKGE